MEIFQWTDLVMGGGGRGVKGGLQMCNVPGLCMCGI